MVENSGPGAGFRDLGGGSLRYPTSLQSSPQGPRTQHPTPGLSATWGPHTWAPPGCRHPKVPTHGTPRPDRHHPRVSVRGTPCLGRLSPRGPHTWHPRPPPPRGSPHAAPHARAVVTPRVPAPSTPGRRHPEVPAHSTLDQGSGHPEVPSVPWGGRDATAGPPAPAPEQKPAVEEERSGPRSEALRPHPRFQLPPASPQALITFFTFFFTLSSCHVPRGTCVPVASVCAPVPGQGCCQGSGTSLLPNPAVTLAWLVSLGGGGPRQTPARCDTGATVPPPCLGGISLAGHGGAGRLPRLLLPAGGCFWRC